MFLYEQEIIQLNEKHPQLVSFQTNETLLKTPEGKGNIIGFAAMGGELDAKFNFEKKGYNYYSVFQSKEDGTYHFGFVITPGNFIDESDVDEFDGIWKVGTTEYTEKEFENKFKRVSLK